MAKRERRFVCEKCHHSFHAVPRHTVIGRTRTTCPQCGAGVIYPLGPRVRAVYAVILAAIIFALFFASTDDQLVMVMLAGMPVFAILISDYQMRRNLAKRGIQFR